MHTTISNIGVISSVFFSLLSVVALLLHYYLCGLDKFEVGSGWGSDSRFLAHRKVSDIGENYIHLMCCLRKML